MHSVGSYKRRFSEKANWRSWRHRHAEEAGSWRHDDETEARHCEPYPQEGILFHQVAPLDLVH